VSCIHKKHLLLQNENILTNKYNIFSYNQQVNLHQADYGYSKNVFRFSEIAKGKTMLQFKQRKRR